MRPRYSLFICERCGEQHQYAGFCDACNLRLKVVVAIPVPIIREAAKGSEHEDFVESLTVL